MTADIIIFNPNPNPVVCSCKCGELVMHRSAEGLYCKSCDTLVPFEQQLADIYTSLAERQEPLGAEFEKVWSDNIEELYEYDDTAPSEVEPT